MRPTATSRATGTQGWRFYAFAKRGWFSNGRHSPTPRLRRSADAYFEHVVRKRLPSGDLQELDALRPHPRAKKVELDAEKGWSRRVL